MPHFASRQNLLTGMIFPSSFRWCCCCASRTRATSGFARFGKLQDDSSGALPVVLPVCVVMRTLLLARPCRAALRELRRRRRRRAPGPERRPGDPVVAGVASRHAAHPAAHLVLELLEVLQRHRFSPCLGSRRDPLTATD